MRALLAAISASLLLTCVPVAAPDSWISRGGHRNAAGEWCCGEGDCFIVPKEQVSMNATGYSISRAPSVGGGPWFREQIPFSEAQPSQDGEFWRCQRSRSGGDHAHIHSSTHKRS